MTRLFTYLLVLAGISSSAISHVALCESPYPASSLIEASPLPPLLQPIVEKFLVNPVKIETKLDTKTRLEELTQLCSPETLSTTEAPTDFKTALNVVESDLSIEVKFKKVPGGRATEAEDFEVYVEFSKYDLLVRSSLPRYASDAGGLKIDYPGRPKRLAWLEGKKGSDLLFIIPQFRNCNVQTVAICPRTFVPRNTLVNTSYVPTGVRLYGAAKADGLFAAGSSSSGKLQASVLASKGIELPLPWYDTGGGTTPSATKRYSNLQTDPNVKAPLVESELPILGALEARLDFGDETTVKRTVRNRSSIQISKIEIGRGEKVAVRGAELSIESGPCFAVTHWNERFKQ